MGSQISPGDLGEDERLMVPIFTPLQIKGYLSFWMRYLSELFWRYSCDVPTLVPNNSKNLVCLSVCSLPHFLTEIRLILDICSSR